MKKAATVLWCSLLFFLHSYAQDTYSEKRKQMVESQLITRGIKDKATLNAMRTVERHQLVPGTQTRYAYEDRPLPIGYGQTISQPYIVAYMTETIRPEAGMKILEIGTGSGYQAAILAEIVDRVYTVEIVDSLGRRAQKKLRDLGYKNIHVKLGDGYFGWEEHAPFDAIIVTAATEYIPPPLMEQLKEDGKMVIPVGAPFTAQYLMLVKKKNGKIKTQKLLPVRFVPFTRSD
ncbi:protein-L-isoaspartate(D-aspartate) O-methyltransferase [Sinomicrobium weinanense]|uniref:Protein-L-isoaspartate O-methyltransferase n=1 Tax=Sinomicrobium weinanense TaxID=2842200 RepID=A0A926JSI9_9FLAO|nr:protein-L-isoaspartate(D-aspartate) O-methyltransferase [Sinomicrobium weinanense]MBC9796715.1 protein-L-isoaspartate(D-aspartate) O-methyltransferase [Sinomicrobium weinanense]MBU3123010.1 protein-L-isoaspartate(D-aspartate) O-methyltransferase [Sinomicrobium weinanense]